MNVIETLRRVFGEERGATATEYVVMITLVLLVVFATVVFIGLQVEGAFDTFVTMFTDASS